MLDFAQARQIVPAEFAGLTRLFRGEVLATDALFDKAIATIAKPLHSRLRSHPKLRHEAIAGASRLYRLIVPMAFRFGAVEIMPDRAAFAICETRVTVSWINNTVWNDADYVEPGVALARFSLTLMDGKLREQWLPIAIVSFHAMSRWFERTGKRDHAVLLGDLATLLDADDADDEVETDHGLWIGSRVVMKSKSGKAIARSVRTFHF
jgi:hypothetical protein